jgi:hypothetical protein
MTDNNRGGGSSKTGAPLFVTSCALGFAIISVCVAYFLVKFFL